MTDPSQAPQQNINQTTAPKIEISQTQQNAAIAISDLELHVNLPNEPQQQINIHAKPVDAPINTKSFKTTENSINDVMAKSEQLEIDETAPALETSIPNLTETEENKGSNIDATKNVSTNMTVAESSYLDKLFEKYKELPNWRRLIG
jgi:hypothetical protein